MQAIYQKISLSGLGEAIVNDPGKPITLPGTVQASFWMRLSA